MRVARISVSSVLGERRLDARDEIGAVGLVVGMLELAAAAFGEVTAWRRLVVGPRTSVPSSSRVSPGTANDVAAR